MFRVDVEPDAVIHDLEGNGLRSEAAQDLYLPRSAMADGVHGGLLNDPIEIHPKHGGKRIRSPLQGDGDLHPVPFLERFCKTGKALLQAQIQPHRLQPQQEGPELPQGVLQLFAKPICLLKGLFPTAKLEVFLHVIQQEDCPGTLLSWPVMDVPSQAKVLLFRESKRQGHHLVVPLRPQLVHILQTVLQDLHGQPELAHGLLAAGEDPLQTDLLPLHFVPSSAQVPLPLLKAPLKLHVVFRFFVGLGLGGVVLAFRSLGQVHPSLAVGDPHGVVGFDDLDDLQLQGLKLLFQILHPTANLRTNLHHMVYAIVQRYARFIENILQLRVPYVLWHPGDQPPLAGNVLFLASCPS